uniref:Uncharacterized protein n=1 Tax=Triticum urartu TaxID=4572 RepID=A0A8R7QF04_TRIUA
MIACVSISFALFKASYYGKVNTAYLIWSLPTISLISTDLLSDRYQRSWSPRLPRRIPHPKWTRIR